MMEVRLGMRLRSDGGTEVIVVKAAGRSFDIRCAGSPMMELGAIGGRLSEASASSDSSNSVTILGKRYADGAGELELLCTKAGAGPLVVDGEPLVIKEPKPLPSSD